MSYIDNTLVIFIISKGNRTATIARSIKYDRGMGTDLSWDIMTESLNVGRTFQK